jgi:hypothetical protein
MKEYLLAGTVLAAGIWSAAVGAQQYPTITNTNPRGTAATPGDWGDGWTQERMHRAKPMDIRRSGEPKATGQAEPTLAPTGQSGIGGGILPQSQAFPDPDPSLFARADEQLELGSRQPADGGYPGPNLTFQVADALYHTFPYTTAGKLFFRDPVRGIDFVCSAATTNGNGAFLNKIWTAGHCVAAGGESRFYTNWVYCPAYNNGVDPRYGCWTWASATTTGEWYSRSAFSKDYAGITLLNTGSVNAVPVQSLTGAEGFAWNWPRRQIWGHFGYPAEAPYTGLKLIGTYAEHALDDTPDSLGPPTNSWGSAQTGGSSGSGLVFGWNYFSGYLNSNVSYGYSNRPGELYGPYYDTAACSFWKSFVGYGGNC